MKVLIMGGAGFIGSNLAEAIYSKGGRVRVVDGFITKTGGDIKNLNNLKGKIDLIEKSVERISNLDLLVGESDLIIDCMGLTAHHYGMQNPLEDVRLNIVSHLYLIDALKNARGKKVIYLGSRGQYGRVEAPVIKESTPQNGVDSQGIAKIAAENYYRVYAGKDGFHALSLRLTNCFGENQMVKGPDIGLVGSFIRDILSDKAVKIFGSGKRTKALVYVKDLVRIILDLCLLDFRGFDVYNIAGSQISLEALLNAMIGIVRKGSYKIKNFPSQIKQMDVGEAHFSQQKLENTLDSVVQTALDISIENTINYYKKRIGEKTGDLSM